ncbi:hypothetical protein ABZO31_05385 [Streptomyces sp. HUAS MG47]|uniref:hypothetical protein n=1 Tax=Streptomyces solicamelliae TaxID=3231716 RepID=UPI0038783EA5
MTIHRLLPTQYPTPGERLLRGKGTASAVGAGRAEDWVRLDADVRSGSLSRVMGWRSSLRLSIGFHWVDGREVADWDTAPHWGSDGTTTAEHRYEPEALLAALRLVDDPFRAVRAAARGQGDAGAVGRKGRGGPLRGRGPRPRRSEPGAPVRLAGRRGETSPCDAR